MNTHCRIGRVFWKSAHFLRPDGLFRYWTPDVGWAESGPDGFTLELQPGVYGLAYVAPASRA